MRSSGGGIVKTLHKRNEKDASESDREEDRGEGAREPGDAGAEPGEGVQRPRTCAEERDGQPGEWYKPWQIILNFRLR